MKTLTPEQYQVLKQLYCEATGKELAVDQSLCEDSSYNSTDRVDSIVWLHSYFGALQAALQRIVELEESTGKYSYALSRQGV